ncbi:MAG: hypothetical protein AAB460_02580 [Patescibacteria group bacterium]
MLARDLAHVLDGLAWEAVGRTVQNSACRAAMDVLRGYAPKVVKPLAKSGKEPSTASSSEFARRMLNIGQDLKKWAAHRSGRPVGDVAVQFFVDLHTVIRPIGRDNA